CQPISDLLFLANRNLPTHKLSATLLTNTTGSLISVVFTEHFYGVSVPDFWRYAANEIPVSFPYRDTGTIRESYRKNKGTKKG
ncbi:MAG TPA: hypothetical protein PLJ85_04545, partial [Candidatus Cloacimonas sp.]|nr:hypothetical protein [Candidatus Cloacimonas sp.]